MAIKPETTRGFCRHHQLIDRPFLPLGGIAANLGGCERISWNIEGGVERYKLTLQMARKFCDLQTMLCECTPKIIAIGLAFGSQFQINDARIPAWNLHAVKAFARCPSGQAVERVEGGFIGRKLREKNAGAFNRTHGQFLLCLGLEMAARFV